MRYGPLDTQLDCGLVPVGGAGAGVSAVEIEGVETPLPPVDCPGTDALPTEDGKTREFEDDNVSEVGVVTAPTLNPVCETDKVNVAVLVRTVCDANVTPPRTDVRIEVSTTSEVTIRVDVAIGIVPDGGGASDGVRVIVEYDCRTMVVGTSTDAVIVLPSVMIVVGTAAEVSKVIEVSVIVVLAGSVAVA